jgi:hypothetical protein
MAAMALDEAFYRAAERRIEALTLGLGLAAGLVLLATRGWREGAGVAIGSALGWVNFRWLKQAIHVLEGLATAQAGAAAVRIPKRVYVKFFGRYALLAVVLYAIFVYWFLPAAAVIAGLFSPVGAVVLEVLYGIIVSRKGPGIDESRGR